MYFWSFLCMVIKSTIGCFQFLTPLVLFSFYSLLNFKRVWSPVHQKLDLARSIALALVLDVSFSRLYNYLASQSNHFGSKRAKVVLLVQTSQKNSGYCYWWLETSWLIAMELIIYILPLYVYWSPHYTHYLSAKPYADVMRFMAAALRYWPFSKDDWG